MEIRYLWALRYLRPRWRQVYNPGAGLWCFSSTGRRGKRERAEAGGGREWEKAREAPGGRSRENKAHTVRSCPPAPSYLPSGLKR